MASSDGGKKIVCVGLACLDVVHVVASYPPEDTDLRTADQYSSTGGNACNSSSVLAELGQRCELFCTLADGAMETAVLEKTLKERGVDYSRWAACTVQLTVHRFSIIIILSTCT